MYLWLKKGSAEELKKIGLGVKKDHASGRDYHEIFLGNVIDPTRKISDTVKALVEEITVIEHIYYNFQKDGVYKKDGVTILAEKQPGENRDCQKLSISGPTLEKVEEIYTLFRQGKLVPTKKWVKKM
jgi:hypothetical protein